MTDRLSKKVAPLKLEVASGRDVPADAVPPQGATPGDTDDGEPSPFTDAPGGPVFETEALRDRLEALRRVVVEGDTVAVVEGEKGAGKTTFLRWFLSRAGDDWDICHITARMALGERHVLARLGQVLFSEAMTDSTRIAARLVERGRRGPFTVIVVDDARNLSAFALKALFDFKRAVAQSGGRIGVVLTASPLALESMFATPSLSEYRREWLTSIELPHFTESQTGDYVRHRIETAGLGDRVTFDDNQIRAIHRGSGGIPSYVNRLAGDMLTGARPRRYRSERQQHRISRHRKAAMTTVALSLALIVVGYAVYAVAFKPSTFDMALEDAVLRGGVTATAPSPALPGALGPPAADGPAPAPALSKDGPDTAATETAEAAAGDGRADPETGKGGPAPAVELTGNAWLMAQDPESYTIQLAGTPEEDNAHRFIDKSPLNGDIIAVRTRRGNRTWYMVLYNSYPSAEAARRDIDQLPAAVRRNQPFARRFASVQAIAAE